MKTFNMNLCKNVLRKLKALTLFATLISCEVVVEVPIPDFEPSLVLNSFYNSDSSIFVSLTVNKYILDNRYYSLIASEATVTLYEEDKQVALLTEVEQSGFYRADFVPVPGREYRITAEKTGYKTIASSSTIPAQKASFELKNIESKSDEYGYPENHLTYSISDELGEDYYETKLYSRIKQYDHEYNEDEDSLYITYIGERLIQIYFTIDQAELNEFEDYSSLTVFSDELFNGRTKEFKIRFSSYYNYDPYTGEENDTLKLILQVRHVSEEYYKYLVTSELQYDVDGDPFSEPVQVFNNIENGFGIFAGYNSSSYEFEYVRKEEN